MTDKFKGIYRIETTRLPNWDYRNGVSYYITICTNDRKHYFGEVENKQMIVSPAGAIAHVLWHEIKNHVPDIELKDFIVMPNHIHGILLLPPRKPEEDCDDNTLPISSKNEKMASISPKPGSLSTIIRSYKSAVTKYCNALNLEFTWQSRFYDHVIKDDAEFKFISDYINDNPAKWKDDRFY